MNEINVIKTLQKNYDEKAFNYLFDKYRPMLLSICLKCKRKNPMYTGTLEMLEHHATIALYDAVEAFDISRNIKFSTYVYLITERKVLRIINKTFFAYNKMHTSIDNDESLVVSESINEPTIEYEVVRKSDLLEQVLESFDLETQKIAQLRIEEKMKYVDISKKLDIPYKRINYKVAKLKKYYLEYMKNH